MSKKNKEKKNEMAAGFFMDRPTDASTYPHYVTMNDVNTTWFKPITTDHTLQKLITQLMHDIVLNSNSDKTLAEMGFFHQISILCEDGRIHTRVYFHPELATYKKGTANGRYDLSPIPQLGIFNGYLFVLTGENIDLTQVIGFDKVMLPKCKIEYDEAGKPALVLKKDASDLKLQEAMYLECNLPITVAAAMDLDLADANFSVKALTVGMESKKKKIMIDGKENSYPVWINVTHSHDNGNQTRGYDVNSVIPYLTSLSLRRSSKREVQKELMQKAADKAEKQSKKGAKKNYKYM